jgi:hypothetical protein
LRDSGGVAPVIVGGAQHSVVCPAGSRSATAAAPQNAVATAAISNESIQRATSVKQRHQTELLNQPAVLGIGVGRSEDDPTQPAVIIFTDKNEFQPAIPRVIDGVRTRVVPSERFRAQRWNEKAPRACSVPHLH